MKMRRKRRKGEKSAEPVDAPAVESAVASPATGDGEPEPSVPVDEQAEATEAAAPEEDWHDRYLRLAAEFDNFRKRSAREFESVARSAAGDLISDLTEVLDNFGRALDADHKGESAQEFADGVGLIRDQLWQALDKRGLERMEAVGQPFDPESHDAMMRMPSDNHDEGIVIQEISPGYRLQGRVLRHARVIVSQGASSEESGTPGDAGTRDDTDDQ